MAKAKKPKPTIFRLYPENKSLYVRVLVFRDKEEMLGHIRKDRGQKEACRHEGAGALATSYDAWNWIRGKLVKKPYIGEILCHREQLSAEVAAHEIGHIALGWAERVNLDLTDRSGADASADEERFCYALGHMMQQFTNHAHRLKVWGS